MTEEIEATPPNAGPSLTDLEAAQQAVNAAIHRKRSADLAVTEAEQAAARLVAEARAKLQEATDAVTTAFRTQNDIQDALMGRTARPRATRKPRAEGEPSSNGRGRGRAPRARRPASPVSASGQGA
jgi:hypothetical protein